MRERTVLLAGATGLVGGEILRLLSSDNGVKEIRLIVRRPIPASLQLPKVSEHIVDFDNIDTASQIFKVDQLFSAMGTTIKKAGSQEAFRLVDLNYPLKIARLALEQGTEHFFLVSAINADSKSTVFYNRVKGELEDEILKLGYRSVTIARPSLLLGERSEFRIFEEVGKRLGWLFPKRWQPVEAAKVAAALVYHSKDDSPGVRILENTELIGI